MILFKIFNNKVVFAKTVFLVQKDHEFDNINQMKTLTMITILFLVSGNKLPLFFQVSTLGTSLTNHFFPLATILLTSTHD